MPVGGFGEAQYARMADKFIRETFIRRSALRISSVAVLAQCLEMQDRGKVE